MPKKDTTSRQDTIGFNLQDQEGNIMFDQALSITVLRDQSPPSISINRGLTLKEDTSAPITADILSAEDEEMGPTDLSFIVRIKR